MITTAPDRNNDRHVLALISMGLIVILLSIVLGLFLTPRALPNWAENVLVSIATASALKLGDCLSTLVALASGRSVERMGAQLGQSTPAADPATTENMDVAAEQVTVTETTKEPKP